VNRHIFAVKRNAIAKASELGSGVWRCPPSRMPTASLTIALAWKRPEVCPTELRERV